ncbi:MAG TPA: 5-formyltetrahydrofolate cyclo-ligase [Verrucomicrobiae bacterium]|nr:5-formyltetrahydrofolate cyclo-ligase [Verrucomicrobiae bacterium]
MISSVSNSKSELRLQIRERLKNISLAVRTVESMELCARLEPQLRSAQTILFYAPLPDELDVWPLMEKLLKSKICALPAFDSATQTYVARRVKNLETDIVEGKFNVSEPLPDCEKIPLSQFHLILVPGLAFDSHGNRLGRGKGFYDRILSEADGVKCGVAYDFQLLEKIPAEPHDAPVDFIFTPKNCVTAQLN